MHLKNWYTIHGLEEQLVPATELEDQEAFCRRMEGQEVHYQGMDVQNVFSTEFPKKNHGHPEIIKAKREEMRRWKEYEKVDQVAQTPDMQVISSRLVITEKDDGRYKARLVVRGFEEHVYPQSNSPTASREPFKTFLAIAANEGFKIQNMDVKSAFLQGTPLEREVFMEPPALYKRPGIVW